MLSAGVQYGLLVADGTGYFPTARYNKIVSPVEDNDAALAQHEAMQSPEMYRIIIDRYNGRPIPELMGFTNLLKNEFGIIPTTADRGVKTFLENANDLKIIGENRRLRFLMPDAGSVQVSVNNQQASSEPVVNHPVPSAPAPTPSSSIGTGLFQLPIDLEGDKMAYLSYPKGSMTPGDVIMLEHMVDATIAALKKRLNMQAKNGVDE